MAGKPTIELDGRTLEGGGQLLRLSICLSALTSTPVKITNIRGNRSGGGGLKAQHLACVNWLAHACNATVSGAEKGSKDLVFTPGRIGHVSPAYTRRGQVWESRLDIGTAGSTGLALQAILPYILFAPPRNENGELSDLPVHLTITGGTNVSGSPSYDYISQVLLPTLSRIGLPEISTSLSHRGWSHGGSSSIGSLTLLIPARHSTVLPAPSLYPPTPPSNPAPPSTITATFLAPSPTHSALRTALEPSITALFGSTPVLHIQCEESGHTKPFYLLLTASVPSSSPLSAPYILASDRLHARKPSNPDRAARELSQQVCRALHREWESGARADEHLRDQLVVFQALAEGRSRVWGGLRDVGREGEGEREPSLHARTAEWVAREMLGVRFNDEGVEGIGFGRGGLAEGIGNLGLG